ncbi:MAG: DUF2628 domain-containing protein [Nitrospirae bacterium]|nr:DUF2628 domain-containing protein [Nitrospirota bacterium]
MNCKSCGAGVPDGAVFCPACGVRAVVQEPPASGPEYTLVLQTVWDGREEEVAAKLAELAKKDVETAMGYLKKLPLTLGRKFTREKAVRTKEMLEAAGGLVSSNPPLDAEEPSAGYGDLPGLTRHDEPAAPPPPPPESGPGLGAGYGDAPSPVPPGLSSGYGDLAPGPARTGPAQAGEDAPITMADTGRPRPSGGPGPSSGQSSSRDERYAKEQQRPAVMSPDEELALLVGENFGKYGAKFDKFDEHDGYATTWHWPCFLFGFWWFIYRKMYLWAVLDIFLGFFGIFWMIGRGILGNYLYWKHLTKKADDVRDECRLETGGVLNQAMFKERLRAAGGTSGVVVWIAAAVTGIAILGILAAIAIPNFVAYKGKAKQLEAKTNLAALRASQEAYLSANGLYASSFEYLDWTPAANSEGKKTYSYFLSDADVVPGDDGNATLPPGVEAGVETFHYRAVAAGNIDKDDTLDVWVVSDSGQPKNVVNDVKE